MTEITNTLYYAVNGSGQGMVFTNMPVREEKRKIWHGDIVVLFTRIVIHLESEGFKLPPLKWTDEPVKLELNLKVCSEEPR